MGRKQESALHHWACGTKPRPNQRGEHDRDDSPTVESGNPKMPGDFSELEIACWKSAKKILKQRGTLSRGDSEALELWARTKARYITASQALAKEELIVEETRFSKSGNEYTIRVENPYLKIIRECTSQLQAMAKSMGLDPASRQKVKVTRRRKPKTELAPDSAGIKYAHLFTVKKETKAC